MVEGKAYGVSLRYFGLKHCLDDSGYYTRYDILGYFSDGYLEGGKACGIVRHIWITIVAPIIYGESFMGLNEIFFFLINL